MFLYSICVTLSWHYGPKFLRNKSVFSREGRSNLTLAIKLYYTCFSLICFGHHFAKFVPAQNQNKVLFQVPKQGYDRMKPIARTVKSVNTFRVGILMSN